MNQIMRRAKKEITRLGGQVTLENSGSIYFILPNGREWSCNKKTKPAEVKNIVEKLRIHNRKKSGQTYYAQPIAHTYPILTYSQVVATHHFKERMKLMRSQGLHVDEVLEAITSPEEVRLSVDRFLFCKDRVVVVIANPKPGEQLHPLVSILWATDDMWALNPREEIQEIKDSRNG